jgi:DNA polymerase V
MAQEAKIIIFPEQSAVSKIFKPLPNRKKTKLPLFSSRIKAGFPSPADDYMECKISLDDYLNVKDESTFMITVSGHSMYPLICDGDLLVVDFAKRAENLNNKIIIALVDGDFNVKRLKIKDKRFYLIPENTDYPTREILNHEDFEIWGVVTGIIKKLL